MLSFLIVCQVAAVDEDLGMNSQLAYFLEKGDRGLFSISSDGVFHILHSLDREKQSLYIVTITAVDSGNLDLQDIFAFSFNLQKVTRLSLNTFFICILRNTTVDGHFDNSSHGGGCQR